MALFRGSGYLPFRYAYDMTRDLAEPIPALALPPGIEIRPARPEHYRAIWEAEREAFQDNWGYTPWPEENYQRFLGYPTLRSDAVAHRLGRRSSGRAWC